MISVRRSARQMVAELPQKRHAIDDHVAWSERLQDREAALQREIEKQAARDAAASWAWP
ncbi:ATP binding protein [Aureococcus anophagefferens]|nr:ATP binding protein [Aureococcus anophagefferens]